MLPQELDQRGLHGLGCRAQRCLVDVAGGVELDDGLPRRRVNLEALGNPHVRAASRGYFQLGLARKRSEVVHDAEGAREAILNAAEEVFAEHGFDGARIDAIAEVAGYNKSLIFHYYDDKLGLYSAVLKRIDQQASVLQARILEPLLADERLTSDASKFRTFLRAVMRLIFDFLVEHPRMLRMLAWEGAEGWQTMRKIASQFNSDDIQLFRRLLGKAQEAGLIRAGTAR